MSLPVNIVTPDDFTGYYSLYKGMDNKIQAFIDEVVPKALYDLFGGELSKLVVENRNIDESGDSRYYDLIHGIVDDCTFYRGLKGLLCGLVWFRFVSNDKFRQTATGTKVQKAEVSNDASFVTNFAYEKYNESVNDWKALQRFLKQNKEIYPEFKGIDKKFASWL